MGYSLSHVMYSTIALYIFELYNTLAWTTVHIKAKLLHHYVHFKSKVSVHHFVCHILVVKVAQSNSSQKSLLASGDQFLEIYAKVDFLFI